MSRHFVTPAYCPPQTLRLVSGTGCIGGELEPCEDPALRHSNTHSSDSWQDGIRRPVGRAASARLAGSHVTPCRSEPCGGSMLAGDRTLHSTEEPLRPFDPQESGWADLIRSEMDSWFPGRLPVHFQRAGEGGPRGRRAGRAPFALMGALVVLAAAAALAGRLGRSRTRPGVRSSTGRGWHSSRRGVGRRNWGGS
jgi:hypothetical protein